MYLFIRDIQDFLHFTSTNHTCRLNLSRYTICLHSILFTAGRFDEDGSFIGQYGTLQRKQQEHLLQQQMQQQELGIKPGGTYV